MGQLFNYLTHCASYTRQLGSKSNYLDLLIATFKIKYLEKKYNKDYHGADYLEQIEDLKAKIKDKYYNINGSEV